MSQTLTGGCQCGNIRYEVPTEMATAAKCHCRECQKATGSGALTAAAYPEGDVKVTGETKTYTYTSDGGNAVTHHFCPNCGSRLFFKSPAGLPGLTLVLAGSLDDSSSVKPQFVVFASRRPAWDNDDPSIPHFAEMPTQ